MNNFDNEELRNLTPKIFKSVCCESYKTLKGRCYICPENYEINEV
jgi:hypothetical protein